MKKEDEKQAQKKFTKAALCKSREFEKYRDVLAALLDEEEYTKAEAWKRIKAYLNNNIKGGM